MSWLATQRKTYEKSSMLKSEKALQTHYWRGMRYIFPQIMLGNIVNYKCLAMGYNS